MQLSYCTPMWLTFSTPFLHQGHWKVYWDCPVFSPIQANDCFLVADIASFTQDSSILMKLHACCWYLQVFTVGDIIDAAGTLLTTPIWDGFLYLYQPFYYLACTYLSIIRLLGLLLVHPCKVVHSAGALVGNKVHRI